MGESLVVRSEWTARSFMNCHENGVSVVTNVGLGEAVVEQSLEKIVLLSTVILRP
jgi:hypothetical protein